MLDQATIEKCRAFIDSELATAYSKHPLCQQPIRPVITFSRETGAGARTIALQLADYLQKKAPHHHEPWTVFDRNLVEKVLEDHHLPHRMEQYMTEDKWPMIDDGLGELLGLHPAACDLVQKTIETILRLAHAGNVILVGRGASIITRTLPHAFHVRVIGSLEKRAAHISEVLHLELTHALEYVRQEDRRRCRYLKTYFGAKSDDPLQFHLVINTDLVSYQEAAVLIGESALRRIHSPTESQPTPRKLVSPMNQTAA